MTVTADAPAYASLLTDAALERLTAIAQAAGEAVMAVYARPIDVRRKDDESPVTDADHAAEAIILEALQGLAPGIPVIAEEEMAAGREPRTDAGVFWLVDPLDGTKEFIKRNGEFTVNIALVAGGRPRLGVVLAPAQKRLWRGMAGRGAQLLEGGGAARAIATRPAPAGGLTVFASRSHATHVELEDFLKRHRVAERRQAGSSLKFCLLASGEADLYPRFGPTMEWDTAAGQAVLEAAGGQVLTLDGQPLRYGKPGFRNPHFVAWGRPPHPSAA